MAAQAEKFDPYQQWLGIPAEEQPASHYRLLGLPDFENDADAIAAAATRAMTHVRSFHKGPRAATSERLLNELAAAKGCLLDPRRKETYDQSLRVKRGIQSLPRPVAASPHAPAAGAPSNVEPRPADQRPVAPNAARTIVRRRQARKRMRELTSFLLLLCVLVGLVVTAWLLFRP